MASPLDNIRVVCDTPLFGGNIGSICRAMRNAGLSRLVLVRPDPGMDKLELRKMAVRAIDVYHNRQECDSLEEAVADCGAVAMTSGVDGFYHDQARTPRDVCPDLLRIAAHSPVAIVFGTEDKGLSVDQLRLATHRIRIPSHPDYSSLNLSQAVMVLAYELYLASGEFDPPSEKSPPAPHAFRERMFEAWRQTMVDIQFCPAEKLNHMMMGFRRILSRGLLTENDVKILHGLSRQCSWAAKRAAGDGGRGGPSRTGQSPPEPTPS